MGSLAYWALGCLLDPFRDALLVVEMFASKFDQLLSFLELAVANRAEVFLIFVFQLVVAIVLDSFQVFDLIFCQALILI